MIGDTNSKVRHITRLAAEEEPAPPETIQRSKAVRHSTGIGKWFKLSAVASSPMTGKEQTCSVGVFSEVTGAANTNIYVYPQIDVTQYQVNDYVYAVYVGDSWIALYNTPVPFDEC